MDKLQEVVDWMFMHDRGSAGYEVRVGIWDSEMPFTVYAVLYEGSVLVAGESTYGSDTVEEALEGLLEETKELGE
jgi:hypothetical protein